MANDLVVVKANSLIEASYKLTLDEMRLLALTIGTMNPKDNKQVFEFTVDDFMTQFPDLKKDSVYEQIKLAIKRISERWVYTEDDERITEFRWVSSRTYFKKEGRFRIALTNEIMPYLTQLKGQFTKYQLDHISGFSSVHAIRIYELCMQYKSVGEREISVDDLKKWLQVEDKYPRFNNFNQWVLTPSISEINAKSDLTLTVEPIKRGRSIVALHFTIKPKKQAVISDKSLTKLGRPKYPKRPAVKVGSHEEGVYFRSCINIFKEWLKSSNLTLADLPDDEIKLHYKHVRPLGNDWEYKPIVAELKKRGITVYYNNSTGEFIFEKVA